ncbi:hypothetical protein ABZ905_31805 [Streptomyces parvus]|uniref:hypothetical protein n=1 Tax=Streptomyces parvus TaxID=66428 RepID=UPI0033EB44B0
MKTLPQPDDPAAAEDPAAVPPEPQPPQDDDARPWAGDMYDEGDESDPAHAYASFSGPAGEQAWLDKAPDGTLTGWVRDETGQVWRYADPDTWAIDVDDSGMAQTGGTGDAPPDASQSAPAGDPGAAAPGGAESPSGGLPIDFGTADEVMPADGAEAAGSETDAPEEEDPEADPLEDEDDEEEESQKPFK